MSDARRRAVETVAAGLGHAFKDPSLLEQALTHPSAGSGQRTYASYQRMEFLGDRVLGLVVSESLYRRYPEAGEGELSKRHHALVEGSVCARVAERLDVGPALLMGGGQRARIRVSEAVLGDACEALIAAVYLDGGWHAAQALVERLWAEEFEAGRLGFVHVKSALQEWAAANGKTPPIYAVVEQTGPAHQPVFTVEVRVDGLEPARARGRSRQEAEKAAASALTTREGLL